jgi:mannose/fructose/N-acetylgalactosamine-specific phosphotransferase system component IID
MKKIKIALLSLWATFSIKSFAFAEQGIVGSQNDTTLSNPLGNVTSINDFIGKIIDLVLFVAVPVLVLVFIWLGFQFIMAQGNSTELEKVKRNLLYTLIGAAIVLGATVIKELLVSTFDSLR